MSAPAMEDNSTSASCSSPIHKNQKDTILYILGGLSIAAFITCVTGLVIIGYSRLYQKFIHRLVSYQLIGASVFACAISSQLLLLQYDPIDHHALCVVEGVLLTYTTWLKLLFLASLTLHLFIQVCCFVKYKKWLEVMYVAVPVLAPLLVCFIPLIHDSYGIAGAWCWIKGWYHNCPAKNYYLGIGFQYGVFYVPVLAGQLVTTVIIISALSVTVTMVRMSYVRSDERRQLLNKQEQRKVKYIYLEVMPLVPYPITFLCLFIPPFVNRIINQTSNTANYGAFIASAISIPCWGLFSGIISLIHTIIVLVMHRRNKQTAPHELTATRNQSSNNIIQQPDDRLLVLTTNRRCAARVNTISVADHISERHQEIDPVSYESSYVNCDSVDNAARPAD